MTWASLASSTGLALTPATPSDDLIAAARRDETELGEINAPASGELPEFIIFPLVEILQRNTATPEACYFAVWDGIAGLSATHRKGAAFTTPARHWFLHRGPIIAAHEGFKTENGLFSIAPNIWWPSDRQWIVATEVDYRCTYIGCNEITAQMLLNSQLEILRVPSEGFLSG